MRPFAIRFAIMLLVVSAIGTASGQQPEPETPSTFFVQTAATATFVQQPDDDNRYTLVMRAAPTYTAWLTPDLQAGSIHTTTLRANWAGEVRGILQAQVLTIDLTLSAVIYDSASDTLTYTAVINQITDPRANKATVLPGELYDVTLFIPADLDLSLNLVFGSNFLMARSDSNLRTVDDDLPNCDDLPTTIADVEKFANQVGLQDDAAYTAYLEALYEKLETEC